MKNLNIFSKLCSPFLGSQSSDVGFDGRSTVARPSFDCRSTVQKLVSVLVLVFTIGIGQMWGATARFIWNAAGNTMKATSGTQGQIDLSTAKNSAGSNPAYTSNQLRLYYASNGSGGSVILDAKTGYVITSVTIISTTAPKLGYKINSGSYSTKSWDNNKGPGGANMASLTSLSASKVTLQNQNTTNTSMNIHSIIVVYQASGGSSGDYEYKLIEDDDDIEAGEYLIVYNNTYALNTHSGNMDANTYGTFTDISSYYSSKKIASNSTTDALAFVVEATTNGYSFYRELEGSYLGCMTSTNDGLRWDHYCRPDTSEWTLDVNEMRSVKQTGRYVKWNNSSDPKRFATYTSGSNLAIQLYKKIPAEDCDATPSVGAASLNGSFL